MLHARRVSRRRQKRYYWQENPICRTILSLPQFRPLGDSARTKSPRWSISWLAAPIQPHPLQAGRIRLYFSLSAVIRSCNKSTFASVSSADSPNSFACFRTCWYEPRVSIISSPTGQTSVLFLVRMLLAGLVALGVGADAVRFAAFGFALWYARFGAGLLTKPFSECFLNHSRSESRCSALKSVKVRV